MDHRANENEKLKVQKCACQLAGELTQNWLATALRSLSYNYVMM